MNISCDLLANKPEQEARLLYLLVNKLGDPSRVISSKCIELLKKLIYKHPAMKYVVIREVRQFTLLPNLSDRGLYVSMIFLSQVQLLPGDHEVASQLVDCYISLFEKCIVEEKKQDNHQGKSEKKDKTNKKGNTDDIERKNANGSSKLKLLSVLLTGVNKAFPFLKDKTFLYKTLMPSSSLFMKTLLHIYTGFGLNITYGY